MVFGLFNRTSDQTARLPTPTPSVTSVAHHSPFRLPTALRSALGGSTTDLTLKDSVSDLGGGNNDNSAPPPATPSPPPNAGPNETHLLYDLISTIPPKTLHAYTLAHLRPQPLPSTPALASLVENTLRPPSPDTVTKLASFFSTLAPPPLLHCVRCHKGFFDIENEEKDKACRVPHDDDSALVSRISGGGYETLWGCCGQTASGDGSEGPPDGWCYEGRHTIDVKRARFRADSTLHDDKLTSCLKLNCHGIRDQRRDSRVSSPSCNVAGMSSTSTRKSNPSPARSQASHLAPRSARKHPRKSLRETSGSENEADAESLAGRGPKAKAEIVGGGAARKEVGMVDEPNPTPKSKPKSQPLSRARPPSRTSTVASGVPVASTQTQTKTISRTLLSQSHTHLASDSDTSTPLRPMTKSHVREESRGRTASKRTRADLSERAVRATKRAAKQVSTSEEESESIRSDLALDSDTFAPSRPMTRSRVREESRGHTTSKLTRGDLSERAVRAAKEAAKRVSTSEGEPEAIESDHEERGRDRKKRRVGRG